MKLKKILFTLVLLLGLLILCKSTSYAGTLELKDLKYDVKLNSDGSATVVEYWDIYISDTNTLFKTFKLDSTKFSGFKNASIIETTNGVRKEFKQIYQEQYHVTKNCYYALQTKTNEYEIAWGVSEDDSSARRQFEMHYTIIDAVKNYSDCSEFYWQFLNTTSAIPAKKITGTIYLPSSVETADDLRVWAHGPLNGVIERAGNNKVTFEVTNLKTYTMLETRVVTPTYVFPYNKNTSSSPKLDKILSEEMQWAEEANRQREYEAFKAKCIRILTILFLTISNIGGIFLAIKLTNKKKKYKEELEKAPNIVPSMPSKYYREIPNELSTPAQASYLYYFKGISPSNKIPNVISATLLDLCLKKYITIEPDTSKKNNVKITLIPNMNKYLLSRDEFSIYSMFEKVSSSGTFTLKDFEKYARNHPTAISTLCSGIDEKAKEENENHKNYDSTLANTSSSWAAKAFGFVMLTILSAVMVVNIIPSIICASYCMKISRKYNTLTQKGTDEAEAWKGLKNYMEDFSLLKEREVPELALWEKYLVYATAFGIADKVLKQLKVVYPQLSDTTYMTTHGYTYLYIMNNSNFSTNFINSISSSFTNSYNTVSSGSGSGGGFSGGGGRRRRRWRNGWKINLLNKFKEKYIKDNKNRLLYIVYFLLFIFMDSLFPLLVVVDFPVLVVLVILVGFVLLDLFLLHFVHFHLNLDFPHLMVYLSRQVYLLLLLYLLLQLYYVHNKYLLKVILLKQLLHFSLMFYMLLK